MKSLLLKKIVFRNDHNTSYATIGGDSILVIILAVLVMFAIITFDLWILFKKNTNYKKENKNTKNNINNILDIY